MDEKNILVSCTKATYRARDVLTPTPTTRPDKTVTRPTIYGHRTLTSAARMSSSSQPPPPRLRRRTSVFRLPFVVGPSASRWPLKDEGDGFRYFNVIAHSKMAIQLRLVDDSCDGECDDRSRPRRSFNVRQNKHMGSLNVLPQYYRISTTTIKPIWFCTPLYLHASRDREINAQCIYDHDSDRQEAAKL